MTAPGSRHLDFPSSNRESFNSNSISINELKFQEELPYYPVARKSRHQITNLSIQALDQEDLKPPRKIKRNKKPQALHIKENQGYISSNNMVLDQIEMHIIDDCENAQTPSHRIPKRQVRNTFEESNNYKIVQADTSTQIELTQPHQVREKPVKSARPNKDHIKEQSISNIFDPRISGLEKLNILSSIFVKQKFEMLEMLAGCDTENRYKVYAANNGLERVGKPIFKCKERSGFLSRNCLR